ncbi:hypothetical protein QBC41DRAFT_385820 [Cercophora samala]|uniref:Polyketide synthase-like phosphopantetheine-binding domain-containing protein n=1 Tax=Cercophora samala TaxID=330535 RepID=A0AA39YTG4_9PEZI|nr:hypothetical protein QBC41DRAFT_385820 [Cercophora samala]
MRTFIPPKVTLEFGKGDGIQSLCELVEFHAENNPEYLFCIQAEKNHGFEEYSLTHVTYAMLKRAITNCCQWLEAQVAALQRRIQDANGDYDHGPPRPVALLMDSDLGLAVYILALMRLGIPAVLLSTRLSTTAVQHLLQQTGATAAIVSRRLLSMLKEPAPSAGTNLEHGAPQNPNLEICIAAGYQTFLRDLDPGLSPAHNPPQTTNPALILHSSGTSGLPKPIPCSHAHFLAFSQCHEFETAEQRQGLTLSSSPFFHEIASLPHNRGISALQKLDFIAFGGGLPNPSIGQKLDAAGVRLINHYGATETGPLTPFFVPRVGHDWRFVRLRRDITEVMEGELTPVVDFEGGEEREGRGVYKLSLRPLGWKERFELQDLLVARDGRGGGLEGGEFSVAGRTDDLICLATGEKVRPGVLEGALARHGGVKAAVAVGEGRFEVGVVVETVGKVGEKEEEELRGEIWPLVEEAGREMDAHARVSSPAAILFVGPGGLPRSDKGTVLRREVNRVYAKEIEEMYRGLEAAGTAPAFDLGTPRESVRGLVKAVATLPDHWSDDDDFFELGMDSLQATKLRRLLAASLRAAQKNGNQGVNVDKVADDVVYRNPSVSRLAEAIVGQNTSQNGTSSLEYLEQMADKYSNTTTERAPQGAVVVITGSTGSLGSFILAQLVKSPTLGGVIALLRPSTVPAHERQKKALKSKSIELSDSEWSKIETHEADLGAPFLGLDGGLHQKIASKATHVVHVAWPMNFNMSLQSFGSAFRALQNLIQLSCESHRIQPSRRPRLLFISSISTVGNYPSQHGQLFVPEEVTSGQSSALQLGYAEAKLVCEKMVERAARDHPQIQAGFARVGQIAGSQGGYWNVDEHFVALVASSCKVRKLPDLQGTHSWLPVDATAAAVVEILFNNNPLQLVYHLENPVRQSWQETIRLLANELEFTPAQVVPFEQWLEGVMSAPDQDNPAKKLSQFFQNEFGKMSCGGIILDTAVARRDSPTLKRMGTIDPDQVRLYIQYWRNCGVLG